MFQPQMFEDILFPSCSKHMQYTMHYARKADTCKTQSQGLKELSVTAGNLGKMPTVLKEVKSCSRYNTLL